MAADGCRCRVRWLLMVAGGIKMAADGGVK